MNWENLERDLEEASRRPRPEEATTKYHILEMRRAIAEWPAMKVIIEELIRRTREDRPYADAYRTLLARGKIPEGHFGMPRDSMG